MKRMLSCIFTLYSILIFNATLCMDDEKKIKSNMVCLGTAVKLTIKCKRQLPLTIKNDNRAAPSSEPSRSVFNALIEKKEKKSASKPARKKRKIEKEFPAQLLSLPETSIQHGVISKKPSIDELTKEFFMQDNDDVDVDWDAFSNLNGKDL